MGPPRPDAFASILRDEFPFSGRRKSFEVDKSAARKGSFRGAHYTNEAEQSFFIHLVAAEQVRVVAEVPKKPVQFPERLLGAVDSSRNFLGGKITGLENREAENEERLLRVPTIVS